MEPLLKFIDYFLILLFSTPEVGLYRHRRPTRLPEGRGIEPCDVSFAANPDGILRKDIFVVVVVVDAVVALSEVLVSLFAFRVPFPLRRYIHTVPSKNR